MKTNVIQELTAEVWRYDKDSNHLQFLKKSHNIENGSFVRQPHNFGHTIFIFLDWMDIFCQEIVQRLRTTTSHGADNFLRQFYIILYNVWAYHIWDFWYVRTKLKIFPLVFEPLHDAFYGHHYDSLVFKVIRFYIIFKNIASTYCKVIMVCRDTLGFEIRVGKHCKQ